LNDLCKIWLIQQLVLFSGCLNAKLLEVGGGYEAVSLHLEFLPDLDQTASFLCFLMESLYQFVCATALQQIFPAGGYDAFLY
jgi:hypothetical protein